MVWQVRKERRPTLPPPLLPPLYASHSWRRASHTGAGTRGKGGSANVENLAHRRKGQWRLIA